MSAATPAVGTLRAYAPWRRRSDRPARNPYRKVERHVMWMAPLATFLTVSILYFYLDKAIAAVLGAIVLTWLARKPGTALRWLIVVLPFATLTLSFLWKIGLPYQLVKPAAFWKEAMIAAVVIAGVLKARTAGIRADLLDFFCLGYIVLGLAYLFAPAVFVDGIGAGVAFGSRLNGYRIDVIYVVLFLAARHARIPAAEVLRCARAFGIMAGIVAGIAIFEFFAASTWNNFVINTMGLPSYKYFILNIRPQGDPYFYHISVYTSVAGRDLLRVVSVVLNFQSLAFLMVVAAALLAETQVHRRTGRRGLMVLALPAVVTALIFTQTRSAFLCLAVVFALVVLRQPGRVLVHRIRMAIAIGALALLAVPLVFAIGLNDRLAGKDDISSNEGHANSTAKGLELLFDEPLGAGLATAAGAGQGVSSNANVTENQFLQIGTQLGILGLALWAGSLITAVVWLGRALRRHRSRFERRDDPGTYGPRYAYDADGGVYRIGPDDEEDEEITRAAMVASGARTALVGMLPAMIFLQPFIYFEGTWALWGIAGAALGALEVAGRGDQGEAVETSLPAYR